MNPKTASALKQPRPAETGFNSEAILRGGGEMGERIRCFDWSQTPLGAPATWSPALHTTVNILLANSFPMLLWWGPDYISIYNDPYRAILGQKHPWALGKPLRECWSEIWDVLQPLVDTPFRGGEPTWVEDIELQVKRSGFTEETHFTVSYSPVADAVAPSAVGGVLATVHEITEKVVGQRRNVLLRDLGTRAAEGKTAEDACRIASGILSAHVKDIPFALLYLTDPAGKGAQLAASCGIGENSSLNPAVIDLDTVTHDPVWPLAAARETEAIQVVENLSQRFAQIPRGPWSNPPQRALVVPIRSHVPHQFFGFFVSGVSSHLPLDEEYRNFLVLATSQISTAIANAKAYEEERKRADKLAEIDRAKTVFFSNVSHEFRTPLTLMLSPLEEVLARGADGAAQESRELLQVAHRNALRLQKLVNTLLEFSRIEAGRIQASYAPTDLAALTCDLASNFRSACDKAGLQLTVDCPPLAEPVYVDQEMWEKIVLNLLSNALKFTFNGGITVRLEERAANVVLSVCDTGVGIAEAELPHIFERFRRVEGAQGRSFEGSGIGLALTNELVKLHGGTVEVKSRPGAGSAFTVMLPKGSAHLPQGHITARVGESLTSVRAEAFTGEALSWLVPATVLSLPSDPLAAIAASHGKAARARVVIADDNADMREHLCRILSDYEITAVGDGAAALQAARELKPELVLADVMMPGLDGFGLLQALRSDEELRRTPVILVSARAGEEARIEGMESAADDYVTKPFNARELATRVRTHIQIARFRQEAESALRKSEERFRAFVTASSDVIYRMSADWSEMRELQGRYFIQDTQAPTRNWLENYILEEDRPGVLAAIDNAIRTKTPFELEHRVMRSDGSPGWTFSRAIPLLDASGNITEWFGAASDVTARKQAEEALREDESQFRQLAESVPQLVWTCASDGSCDYLSHQWGDYTGIPCSDQLEYRWLERLHPDDRKNAMGAWQAAIEAEKPFDVEFRIERHDGTYRWFKTRAVPYRDSNGRIIKWFGTNTDIEEQKHIEQELRAANADLEQFAYSASHDLQEPLRNVSIFSELLARRSGDKLDGECRQFLGYICTGATRMEMLVRDLLAYTQVSKFELPWESADAEAAFKDTLENLRQAIAESQAQITSDALPWLHVHGTHLCLLFQNLIGNALKYRSRNRAPVVHVSAERQDRHWLFCVADNGIGIDPEHRERIFGLFKRLHTGDEYSGTGIGLAICQRIVARYHGRIWVDSESGQGSRFRFTLPA